MSRGAKQLKNDLRKSFNRSFNDTLRTAEDVLQSVRIWGASVVPLDCLALATLTYLCFRLCQSLQKKEPFEDCLFGVQPQSTHDA